MIKADNQRMFCTTFHYRMLTSSMNQINKMFAFNRTNYDLKVHYMPEVD